MRLQIEPGRKRPAEHYPTQGVSSSATIEGVDSSGETLFGEEAVALDAFSQALTADALRGATALTVADGSAAVPGRRYWIAPADALGFEVVIRKATAAGELRLLRPLRQDLVIGDEIAGHGLRRAITETATAQVGASLIWRWTVNGEEHTKRQYLDIVDAPYDCDLSEGDLEEADWVFGEQLGEYGQLDHLVLEARRDIWRELVAHSISPHLLTTKRDLLDDALKWRARWLRYVKNERLEPIFRREYESVMRAVIESQQWTGG